MFADEEGHVDCSKELIVEELRSTNKKDMVRQLYLQVDCERAAQTRRMLQTMTVAKL